MEGTINQAVLHDIVIFKEFFDYDFTKLTEALQVRDFSLITDYVSSDSESKVYNSRIRERICSLAQKFAKNHTPEEMKATLTEFYKDYGVGRFGLHKAFRVVHDENGVQITMKSEGEMQYIISDSTKEEMVYNTLTTPSQCDFSFTLADGTRVWLNAQSSLRYPVAFTGKERVVYAEGEIYLEVAKDTEHPFFVVSNGRIGKGLGTSFNVNAYPDEAFTEVTLVEGRVAAHVADQIYNLLPSKQLRWDKDNGIVDIKAVNVNDYIAWKNGQYIFKGKPLVEVAKVLQRWYEVEIIFENKECEQAIYTGVINKEERIDVFVERLDETSQFDCRVEGNKVFIK